MSKNDLLLRNLFLGGREARCQIDKIPLSSVNVLPQPRKTFENIEELAENIATNGLLNPLIVACFTEEEVESYLKVINEIWGTFIHIKSLIPDDLGYYNILIAGERRFRSLNHLWQKGCQKCSEEHGQEFSGVCFNRHFEDSKVGASLWKNISASKALFFQFSENIHKPVPAAEEAEAYQRLFVLIKRMNAKFTMASFARSVGRSIATISNAVKFCALPDLIQKAAKIPVKQGGIPYGIALQLSRLQRVGESEESMLWWMTKTVITGCNVKKFKKSVTDFLIDKESGQQNFLVLIMTKEQEEAEKKSFIKRTVAKTTIREIWSYIAYFKRVLKLFENGQLGLENSAFSSGSPSRVYKELVDLMDKQLLRHMKQVLSRQDSKQSKKILAEAQSLSIKMKEKFNIMG